MKSFLLILACFTHVEEMGSDRFAEREAAQVKLKKASWHAYPALLKGIRHPDIEIRHRSRKLIRPLEEELENWIAKQLAHAFFYHDNWKSPWLSNEFTELYDQLSDEMRHRLLRIAQDKKLHIEGVSVDFTNVGWINIMRHRVLGLPDPTP